MPLSQKPTAVKRRTTSRKKYQQQRSSLFTLCVSRFVSFVKMPDSCSRVRSMNTSMSRICRKATQVCAEYCIIYLVNVPPICPGAVLSMLHLSVVFVRELMSSRFVLAVVIDSFVQGSIGHNPATGISFFASLVY